MGCRVAIVLTAEISSRDRQRGPITTESPSILGGRWRTARLLAKAEFLERDLARPTGVIEQFGEANLVLLQAASAAPPPAVFHINSHQLAEDREVLGMIGGWQECVQ